jgi:hypothetical protein
MIITTRIISTASPATTPPAIAGTLLAVLLPASVTGNVSVKKRLL